MLQAGCTGDIHALDQAGQWGCSRTLVTFHYRLLAPCWVGGEDGPWNFQKYIRARSLPRCTCLPHSTCMVTGKDPVSLASNAGCSWHQEGTESGLESPLDSAHWWPRGQLFTQLVQKSPKSPCLLWVSVFCGCRINWALTTLREAPKGRECPEEGVILCARGWGLLGKGERL